MDKDKSRTDLLAAGRKKLQQFRKKKETKGKSAPKTRNSEGEGNADLGTSHVDPQGSPKIDEGETASTQGAVGKSSDLLVPLSTENSVTNDADLVMINEPDPSEFVPVQDVVLEPIALVNEEAVGADADSSVSSSLDAKHARGESTLTVEHEDGHDSSLGPSDKSVVVRGELMHAADLGYVDSLASPTMRDNQVEERTSFLSQEISFDTSSNKEREDQEADCSGSNQCDGRDDESHGSVQDVESLKVGYIKLEPDGNQVSVVSRDGETGIDFCEQSHDLVGIEKLKHEAEGAIEGDSVSVIFSDYKVEETNDDAVAAVSVSSEAADEAGGTAYMKYDEEANCRSEGMNEMDRVPVCADEDNNIGFFVSSEAISREERILYIGSEEGTEERTHGTEGIFVGIHDAGDGPGLAVANRDIEGDSESDGEEKPKIQLKGVGADSSCEKGIEVISVFNDLGFEREAGVQADMRQDRLVDESYEQKMSCDETVLVSDRQENPLEEKMVSYGSQSSCCCTGTGSVDLHKLAEIIQGLDEEKLGLLLKLGSSNLKPEREDMVVHENGLVDIVESLRQQLYLTIVAKDIIQMQFSEQIGLQKVFDQRDNQLLNEAFELKASLKETQDCNTGLSKQLAQCMSDLQVMAAGREELEAQSTGELTQFKSDLLAMASEREELEMQLVGAREELVQCRSDLQVVAAGKEEVETQFASARKEIEGITTRSIELQTQLERSHEEMANLLAELAGLRCSADALEIENSKLHENLTALIGRGNKLQEENKYLVHENERLAAQLFEKEEYAKEHDDDLKEATVHLEQLTQENFFLSSSLDVHKAKLKEFENQHSQMLSQATDARDQLEGLNPPMMHGNPTEEESQQEFGKVMSSLGESVPFSFTDEKPLKPFEVEILVDSISFSDLKAQFDEAEKTVQKLEKAIEAMHSHSVSLSRSGGKVAGAGVSKLIQAFELKVHHDENGPTELPLDEGETSTEDHLMLAKEQTSNLRDILKKLDLSALKVNEEFMEEKSSRELVSAALTELQILFEACKQENNNFEARIFELVKKLSEYESRTDAMLAMQQNSDEKEAIFFSQLENLQKDVEFKLSALDQEWNFTISKVSETVDGLDASINRLPIPTSYSNVQTDFTIGRRITASVNAATKVIEDLHEKLGAAYTGLMKMYSSYESLNEKFTDLHVRNGLAVEILSLIYVELEKFTVGSCEDVQWTGMDVKAGNTLDLLHPGNYIYLLNQLSDLLGERSLLKSSKAELEVELISCKQEVAELNKKCIDSRSFLKIVDDVKSVVGLNDMESDSDKLSVSHLESLFAIFVQKYREASEQVGSCKEEFEHKVMECDELQVKLHQLRSFSCQQEDENHILKKNFKEQDIVMEALRSDLQAKGAELEQSEQRYSSVREKLGIAVAKGKGLIVQRDHLKQSLSEMSSELERCSQEVESKDTRLREVEIKLKAYSEAGERIEALESELSYIRNSATALRDSFLLKDSVLQRIEEVLEDLELPEHFHSRDIIEKIEWLARSISGSSLPVTDWHQKRSVGGGSYSDAGFVDMDNWKEDIHPSPDPFLDDLKRKNEELQSRFYGLAEQNEMLEQSLMERNKLVQRLEEVLDRMDIPPQLRSMETFEKIEWLGSALSEAHHDRVSLQKNIENLEIHSGSLTADLEQSQRKISDLELALHGVTHEKEFLSESLENLTFEQEKTLENVTKYEFEKCNLQNEVASLQEKLFKKLEINDYYENQIKKLEVLASDALHDESADDIACDSSDAERLEGLLRKLIEKYMALSFDKSVPKDSVKDNHVGNSDAVLDESGNDVALKSKQQDRVTLKEEFEEVLDKLAHEKAEREKILESYQSLVVNFEALGKQKDELEEKLNQEEMKLVSTRDKLNVAVRKGKGLVQQRDSLKQTIEEMKTDIDHLKNELSQKETALLEHQHKIRDLLTYLEKAETMERECLLLRNRTTELEYRLQDSGHNLSSLINTLNAIDIGSGLNTLDPIKKLETIGKVCYDLQAALTSSEHESKKSKRATELLLAELNEVNERADSLQEELSKVEIAYAEISRERDLAESGKLEAISRLENGITIHSEERKQQFAEVIKFKTIIDQLSKNCLEFTDLVADVCSVNLELFCNLGDGMESLLKQMDSTNVIDLPLLVAPGGVILANSSNEEKFHAPDALPEMKIEENFDDHVTVDMFDSVGRTLQECTRQVDTLREKCYNHIVSRDNQVKRLSKAMEAVYKEIASRKESLDSTKRGLADFESFRKEKDMEILILRRMIALLYKTCTSSILEIENQKSQLVQDGVLEYKKNLDLRLPTFIDEQEFVDGQASFTEDGINIVADTLLLVVKDSANIQAEIGKSSQKELTATISNLQKELQESDIQKNRICAELVNQIKKAEANAEKYLVDLKSTKALVEDLEKQIEALGKERNVLELRIEDLQDGQISSMQLQEKISSLNDLLSAKGQEIEDLMQALDEEESQMEGLRSKIEELENILQQKNLALKNLEASRGKAMAKLSTTVSKFDELHQLSENLLSEVENLQSQLQDRDAEVSFLRQEVTRCTNDVLAVSQESSKRNSTEMHDLLMWLNTMISLFGGYDVKLDEKGCSRMEACRDFLEKKITSVLAELEALRLTAQNKDTLLQVEKTRTEELSHKSDSLEKFLREKELKIASLQGSRDLGDTTNGTSSEISEVEPTINKRAVVGTSVTPHVRSMRKVNNDQVAISIDMDAGGSTLDDDDDKVHGFKSLTTSRVVPKFTRPVSDIIDGLWVSCDRALMRQPALRVGIIIYWIMLHTILAISVV